MSHQKCHGQGLGLSFLNIEVLKWLGAWEQQRFKIDVSGRILSSQDPFPDIYALYSLLSLRVGETATMTNVTCNSVTLYKKDEGILQMQ